MRRKTRRNSASSRKRNGCSLECSHRYTLTTTVAGKSATLTFDLTSQLTCEERAELVARVAYATVLARTGDEDLAHEEYHRVYDQVLADCLKG